LQRVVSRILIVIVLVRASSTAADGIVAPAAPSSPLETSGAEPARSIDGLDPASPSADPPNDAPSEPRPGPTLEPRGTETASTPEWSSGAPIPREPISSERRRSERGWKFGGFTLSGAFDQRYRFRRTSASEDQDLHGTLDLDASYRSLAPVEERILPALRARFQASYDIDIDGFQTAREASGGGFFLPFQDITNTFDDRLSGFVHTAWIEAQDFAILEHLRVGRQMIHREEGILFDGAHARTQRWRTFTFDLYGGLPAHLYEDSVSGDGLIGIGAETRPTRGLSLGADAFYIRDRGSRTPDADEFLWLVRGRYDIDREWTISSSASWVDTRDRRQVIDVRYRSEGLGLLVTLRALRQNGIVGFQTSELSPYLFIEGEYAPHYQYELDVHQPIGDHFGAGAGAAFRHLERSSDEGLYNHEFANYWVELDTQGLWKGFSASVRSDGWSSSGDDIYSVGFDLEQRFGELLRLRAGTSWSLYRIDLFTGTERERDRVYFLRARWRILRGVDLDTDYQYEKDSLTEYHTVTVGMRLWF
jgi:hypothetical protein